MQLKRIYCPNKRCSDYKKRGSENILVIGRYGKKQYRLLRCRTCGFRFSERRLTIFFGMHTDEGTIRHVLISLLGGKSIRRTAKEMGLDKDTVQRIWKRVMESWERSVLEFLEDLNLQDMDLKELFSFPPVDSWRTDRSRRRKKAGIYLLSVRSEGAE
jgi:transposase-like protein